MLNDPSGAILFAHKKNITVGFGRVMYANQTTDVSGVFHPAGWVLPGGRRTQDSITAHMAATRINDLTQKKAPSMNPLEMEIIEAQGEGVGA